MMGVIFMCSKAERTKFKLLFFCLSDYLSVKHFNILQQQRKAFKFSLALVNAVTFIVHLYYKFLLGICMRGI